MSNYLSKLFDESAVGLASRGQLNRPLEPRLWENLRLRLQDFYRKATGESFAVVSVDLIPRRMAAHEREKKPLSIGEVREFVLDWLPSDSAGDDFKARLICRLDAISRPQPASTALVERLTKALEPFADAADYFSNGVHRPIAEDALPCGPALIVKHLREARAALSASSKEGESRG